MKTSQFKLKATQQFDCGRWKLRLALVPFSAGKQTDHEHNPDHLRVAALCCPLRFQTFEKNPKRYLIFA